MIQNLLVLNSAYNGSRDLSWNDDPDSKVIGYNVYRAFDAPTNWTLLTAEPHPTHFYRDQTTYVTVEYVVKPEDWVSFGNDGQWVFKVPERPIWSSSVVKGHPTVANHPMDVQVTIDDVPVSIGRVDGQEGLVYFEQWTVGKGGATSSKRTHTFAKNQMTSSVVKVWYRKLTNYVDIHLAGTRAFYSVVPVLEGGFEQHRPGQMGTEFKNTLEVDQMDYMFAEMVRRNAFIFEQAGEPADLMIRRSKGTLCGCLIGNGEARHGCTSCFETGIIGGYFGPYEILFIDPDTAATRTINEGGVKVERDSRSYLGPSPMVQNGDFIVRRNGERLGIGNVVYKMPRGVLLQQDFDVTLIPRNDSRYKIPLTDPTPPGQPIQTYDPRFVETRELPAEPLTNPLTDPTKTWENPTVPVGRTVKFGNIQT